MADPLDIYREQEFGGRVGFYGDVVETADVLCYLEGLRA